MWFDNAVILSIMIELHIVHRVNKSMNTAPVMLPAVIGMLEAQRGNWRQIADDTGVKYRTIQNIVQGASKEPSVNTVERLYRYLTEQTAA